MSKKWLFINRKTHECRYMHIHISICIKVWRWDTYIYEDKSYTAKIYRDYKCLKSFSFFKSLFSFFRRKKIEYIPLFFKKDNIFLKMTNDKLSKILEEKISNFRG